MKPYEEPIMTIFGFVGEDGNPLTENQVLTTSDKDGYDTETGWGPPIFL